MVTPSHHRLVAQHLGGGGSPTTASSGTGARLARAQAAMWVATGKANAAHALLASQQCRTGGQQLLLDLSRSHFVLLPLHGSYLCTERHVVSGRRHVPKEALQSGHMSMHSSCKVGFGCFTLSMVHWAVSWGLGYVSDAVHSKQRGVGLWGPYHK